jgi:predicted RNA-binding Zn ribbon-like protein
MVKGKEEKSFIFVGNYNCIDYINTKIIKDGNRVDLLEDYSDFISWLSQAHVIDSSTAEQVVIKWGNTAEGELAFEQAIEFREVLRDMVEHTGKGRHVPQPAIEAINSLLRSRPGYSEVIRVRSGFEKKFYLELNKAINLIVPVAESASDLLCHADLSLIKKCENSDCILYFYDTTKNHARRWCSMNSCGNRAKAAAHYKRKRARPL